VRQVGYLLELEPEQYLIPCMMLICHVLYFEKSNFFPIIHLLNREQKKNKITEGK